MVILIFIFYNYRNNNRNNKGNHNSADLCSDSEMSNVNRWSAFVPPLSHHIMRKQMLDGNIGHIYTTADIPASSSPSSSSTVTTGGANGSSVSSSSNSRVIHKYPDLLDVGSSNEEVPGACTNNLSRSKTTSFCTLPRKRTKIKSEDFRNSTDSQSHLLYDINESKSSTMAIANRRFSGDSSKTFRSNSFLNLSTVGSDTASNTYSLNNPSLPTSPVRESFRKELPLLDFSTLPIYTQSILSPQPHSTKSNISNTSYDYQASQLDFFLEEYRVLQKQLTKMQKTCNTLRKLETSIDTNAKLVELSDFSNDHLLLNTAAPFTATTTISSSNDDSIKGILKNKILLPGQPPEPPPYWLHRNAMLKRLNNQDYLPK